MVSLREVAAGFITVDDSEVLPEDAWMPLSRQSQLSAVDDELPPEV